ncbi:MAG: hypothetical protein H6734_15055 [Alphaproteobacteria bacterium]|nr:hypothetical protein [Alphaproteobacteria bacterium]
MRDYTTPLPVQQTPPATDLFVAYANEQVAGNMAAQQDVTEVQEEPGFLETFGFGAMGEAVKAENPVPMGPSSAMKQDQALADQLDILKTPTGVPLPKSTREGAGEAALSTRGATYTRKQVDRNEVLGDATTRDTAAVDVRNGTFRIGRSYDVNGPDGAAGAWGFGAFAQAGEDGQVVAGVGAKSGDIGGSLQGMVDFGADGGLQAVGGGASVQAAGVSGQVNGAVQLGSVVVDGRSVSRELGASVSGDVKSGPVGASAGQAWSYGESLTFADEAQAETYGEELADGEHARVADLSAKDVQGLPDGTRAAYVWKASLKAGGSMLVKAEGHAQGSQTVTLEKSTGDVVRLTVENLGLAGAGGGIDNGYIGTSGSYDLLTEGTTTYEVDLADPEQAAAFERFQSTGDRSGLKLVESEELAGSRATAKAHGFGLSSTEASERLSGVKRDAEKTSDLDRGGFDQDGRNGWDPIGAMETAARWAGSATELFLARRSDREESAVSDEDARARFSEAGSKDGRHTGRLDVLTGRDDGTTLALGEQIVDFDDQQENARFLEDQIDPWIDGPNVDPRYLPPHERTDHAWKLQTQVGPAGIQNIEDLLAAGGPFPCESPLAVETWAGARDAYNGSERTPADLRDVIADAATQGEDALECVAAMAGEQNVERFLSREGDDTFMSAQEHAQLSRSVRALTRNANSGNPVLEEERLNVETLLRSRLERLSDPADSIEVPRELVAAERARVLTHLDQLGAE